MSEQPRCTCEPNYGYVGPCCKTCPRCTERQAALKAAEAALDALRAHVQHLVERATQLESVGGSVNSDWLATATAALLDPPSGGPLT